MIGLTVGLKKRLAVEPSCEHFACRVAKIRNVDGTVAIFSNFTDFNEGFEQRQKVA
jgi:hypothetical protein